MLTKLADRQAGSQRGMTTDGELQLTAIRRAEKDGAEQEVYCLVECLFTPVTMQLSGICHLHFCRKYLYLFLYIIKVIKVMSVTTYLYVASPIVYLFVLLNYYLFLIELNPLLVPDWKIFYTVTHLCSVEVPIFLDSFESVPCNTG